jgi:hypothetical protein
MAVWLVGLAVLATVVTGQHPAAAQQPDPQTVVPGSAAIWTDKPSYAVGESILICYRVPVPGPITITDIAADGTVRVLYSGPSNATGGCLPGTVTPPPGSECLRLQYPLAGGGAGVTQTCFTVIGTTPPPPSTGLTLTTDRPSYSIGDPITICYKVPAPGPVTITETLSNGQTNIVASGYDDGTGGCIGGTVAPPTGVLCLSMRYTYPSGSDAQVQTCVQVYGTISAAAWTSVGSALIDENGLWLFNQQVTLAATLTYLRLSSGACESLPSQALIWEANLVPVAVQEPNVQVYGGQPIPVGLAGAAGGSGYAFTVRPLTTSNPPTQVAMALSGINPTYMGTRLTICFRAP